MRLRLLLPGEAAGGPGGSGSRRLLLRMLRCHGVDGSERSGRAGCWLAGACRRCSGWGGVLGGGPSVVQWWGGRPHAVAAAGRSRRCRWACCACCGGCLPRCRAQQGCQDAWGLLKACPRLLQRGETYRGGVTKTPKLGNVPITGTHRHRRSSEQCSSKQTTNEETAAPHSKCQLASSAASDWGTLPPEPSLLAASSSSSLSSSLLPLPPLLLLSSLPLLLSSPLLLLSSASSDSSSELLLLPPEGAAAAAGGGAACCGWLAA